MDFPPKVNRQLDRSPTSFPLNAPGYHDDQNENYDAGEPIIASGPNQS